MCPEKLSRSTAIRPCPTVWPQPHARSRLTGRASSSSPHAPYRPSAPATRPLRPSGVACQTLPGARPSRSPSLEQRCRARRRSAFQPSGLYALQVDFGLAGLAGTEIFESWKLRTHVGVSFLKGLEWLRPTRRSRPSLRLIFLTLPVTTMNARALMDTRSAMRSHVRDVKGHRTPRFLPISI